jgi:nicotinamidase-related amidase
MLILAGELTDVCVHYTFVDAHQRDYRIKVLEDCVGGSTIERHEAALAAMKYLQRDSICLSTTFLDELQNG